MCHTDYSVMKGLLNAPLPAILGHEGAGIVVAIGEAFQILKLAIMLSPYGVCHAGNVSYARKDDPRFAQSVVKSDHQGE